MSDAPEFLAKRLREEGEKMVKFFRSLRDEHWQKTVYTEGATWTVRDVLAHFVTAEQGFLRLFASILAGGPGATEDFSIDRYNARQLEKTKDLTPRELLAQYRAIRERMVAWVSNLKGGDLERRGRHPFLGETTLAEMVKMVYRHNQIHYRDLRRALEEE